MFTKVALLSAFASLVAGAALDVWAPAITSPTADTVWQIGSVQNVTWCVDPACQASETIFDTNVVLAILCRDTSTQPAQITNPNGEVFLVINGSLDIRTS